MAPQEASDGRFAVLPVRMIGSEAYPVETVHEIRIRPNKPRFPTANDGRTLYLKNIPVDSTEAHFRELFATLLGGQRQFESIAFENEAQTVLAVDPARATMIQGFAKKRKRGDVEAEERREEVAAQLPEIWTRRLQNSGSTATVLLVEEASVARVLKKIDRIHSGKGAQPIWGQGVDDKDVSPLSTPWIATHLRLSRADKLETKNSVHAFFSVFNRKEKEANELAKRLRNEPDEDGFVTVTKGSRNAPASRNEADEARAKMLQKEAKKREELKRFYRFQLREERKREQANLLKGFAAAQEKVAAMKEKRGKFMPES
ncbi:uncharacterized protein J7T54_003506 [Emericellopsis cladophorae]|uniref:Ribosomal RNA-processing protein 7 n=1 Tax=Emericellopsis cladophorae TaxID=2686198 RepID=A0A9Q0BDN8_9HYPO|nr:uncharacterized protein J7T54_003506 [Emericellopsis cladophorae]KAI6782087.1 hypothetical protein J7T54_003506 [Emericellopsis cladophorae]